VIQGEAFPLVPRFRLLGLAFGGMHSARRGLGSDVAGSRPYRPGDDVATIDWAATARLSSARDTDEFIVRERFAEEAPRVVVVADRRPSMSAFPPELPWLRKPRALAVCADLIAASTFAARGLFGYLDEARGDELFWRAPQSQTEMERLEETYLLEETFQAPEDTLSRAFEFLMRSRRSLPPGSFVFVLSDFFVQPPPELWLTLVEHRWDLVPVILRDPIWERSFPQVGGIAVPVVDLETGRSELLRIRKRRARELSRLHEASYDALLDGFVSLGLEPVTVSSVDRELVLQAFLRWSDERRLLNREWRLGA
jgi:Protein of unknown function DUF58